MIYCVDIFLKIFVVRRITMCTRNIRFKYNTTDTQGATFCYDNFSNCRPLSVNRFYCCCI